MGFGFGMFPLLGTTPLLCFLVALALRLNQPVIHLVNQLRWPVHHAMIAAYIKTGARIYGSQPMPFDPEALAGFPFHAHYSWHASRSRFGLPVMHAVTAWLLTLPVYATGLYWGMRPAIRWLANIKSTPAPGSARFSLNAGATPAPALAPW